MRYFEPILDLSSFRLRPGSESLRCVAVARGPPRHRQALGHLVSWKQIKITHAVLLLFQDDGGGAANAAMGKPKSKPNKHRVHMTYAPA